MCGIFAVTGVEDAMREAMNGLKALQGRGHQSSGGGVFVDGRIYVYKEKGPIDNLVRKYEKKPCLGLIALTHTRYATAGANLLKNTHPFVSKNGRIAVVHNGEIVEAGKFRRQLKRQGVKFDSETSDSEVILRMLEHSQGQGIVERVISVLNKLKRAFAVVIVWDGYVIGAVDCEARHPLWLGRIEKNGQVVFRYSPINPNGSTNSIAGICNDAGNVIGLMPHPERFITKFQHPAWTRNGLKDETPGFLFWKSAVQHAKGIK